MYRIVTIFLCLSVLPLGWSSGRLVAQGPSRPNVVLIMTDNHGAWTLGCYGNRDIRTPNIDRLAAEGTLFTHAFASNPVCSPTRATFLTGLLPSQHGVHSFLSGGNLQVGPNARCTLDEITSLPEVLRGNGYRCGLVGKWHLGDNLRPQEGFDEHWITMPHGGTSTFYDAPVIEGGVVRKEPKYLTDLWTEHAVEFIDREAKQDDPFFLFLAYNGPYSLGRLLLKEGRNRHAEYYADKEIASFPRQPPHPWQLNNRDYINNLTSIRRVATEVSGVDDGVGSVLEALKKNGLDENTIVVFVADQGWVGGHGGFFGMGDHTRPLTARDGMMRIPMIWRHPGHIGPGVRSDQLVTNYDFMPTLLGHLGLGEHMPQSPRSPGVDLSPILAGDSDPAADAFPDAVFYEFENLRCIRTTTHKYVRRFPNGPNELYDLSDDPDEFVNLIGDAKSQPIRVELERRLTDFYAEYAEPRYDMWNGGTSQVRIHDGIDEEIAQLTAVEPPPLTTGFRPVEIDVPDGYAVELVAGPPLVTHPTMGCFDDQGHLYVCNNAGVNMTNEQLEQELPNAIHRLTDTDGDGKFDRSTVFADKMTFPMGGTWHDGALYVASPPNIWRLRDTDDDGVADQRDIIVTQFGYNGNAASIHGCFSGPDGRIYWTDGYHGHEFKDDDGKVTSQREGSYLFSCRPDGSDARIHCGGGMDNPVELDFTAGGDMLGTVNILYTRPRVDALVHWLHGGAYPHRERVLNEIKVTGDLLGPAHRFGHVAVSGMTRYRSGVMDHRWADNLFATFFNTGKVVRLETHPEGSSYGVVQREFLSSPSREFHPTDVLEDADGSLLVIDTGGWFYRGCPTSQFSKPDLLGGIYRVRREGMTPLVDPRGLTIDWPKLTAAALAKQFNDTRFAVRKRAVDECVRRGPSMVPTLASLVARADVRVRRNCVAALTRLAQLRPTASSARDALMLALDDRVADIRQSACRGLAESVAPVETKSLLPLLADDHAGVRRTAAMVLGRIGDADVVDELLAALSAESDRGEAHAVTYALIEIGDVAAIRAALTDNANQGLAAMVAIDQIDATAIRPEEVFPALASADGPYGRAAMQIVQHHPEWASDVEKWVRGQLEEPLSDEKIEAVEALLAKFASEGQISTLIGEGMQPGQPAAIQAIMFHAIARANSVKPHPSWDAPITRSLRGSDEQVMMRAISSIGRITGGAYSETLKTLASDRARSMDLRLHALATLTSGSGSLDDETFTLVTALCKGLESPKAAGRAARIIGSAKLTDDQLTRATTLLERATPGQLMSLLPCFSRTRNPKIIEEFLTSVGAAPTFLTLTETELSEVIKRFPQETLPPANELLSQLRAHQQEKRLKLDRLREDVLMADAKRGEKIFMSEKAKCSSCHRVGKLGKRVGPDLSTIGANRSTSDLLESIVFPSASIVRDYGSYKILTTDGRALTGLLVAEKNDAYEIQQASGETVSIATADVETILPNTVSIMPAGLDEALLESELADVVAYLQSLRP